MKAPASSCLPACDNPSAHGWQRAGQSACHPHSFAPQRTGSGPSHGDFQPEHTPLQPGSCWGGPAGPGSAAAPGEIRPPAAGRASRPRGESPGKELIKSSQHFLAGNNFLRRGCLQPKVGPPTRWGGFGWAAGFTPVLVLAGLKKPPKMRHWVGLYSCSRWEWEEGKWLKLKLPDQRPSSSLGGRLEVQGCSNLSRGGDVVAGGMVPVSGPGPSEPGASFIPSACISLSWGPADLGSPPGMPTSPHGLILLLDDSPRAWLWLQGRWGQQPPGSITAVTVPLVQVCN